MILSFGLNGLRESRPSLLITCGQVKVTLLLKGAFLPGFDSNQPDLVLFLHDEESVSVDVEVGGVQEGLQRDQTHDLRAHHRQLQDLNTHDSI